MSASTKQTDRLSQSALALAHPIRRAVIEQIAKGVTTPDGIRRAIDEPLGVVSYHVRMLRDYGIVEVTSTEPVRGALQHFYGFTENAHDDLAQFGHHVAKVRRKVSTAALIAVVAA